MSERKLIPLDDNFRWSFSKLSCYEQCPYSFLLSYMQDPPLPQQGNAFAEYGTLCHSLLEEYHKGTLELGQLTAEYQKRYNDVVVHSFPPYPKGYAEKTYQQGIDYFNSFCGFGDNYRVLSVEEKFVVNVGAYRFSGIADLVLQDKDTGAITVVDHKTKSADSMKKEYDTYIKQLYLYGKIVEEQYGVLPNELVFNMIKSNNLIREKFDVDKYNRTMEWYESTVDDILFDNEFVCKPNRYFCRFICDVFNCCEEGQRCCS